MASRRLTPPAPRRHLAGRYGARMQDLTPEQVEIQRVCREFAANEIRPVSLAVDEADTEVPYEVWNQAAAIGLTSFMLPE
jgi:alkylation response protein AidB-like acyl-CoA dehydrogenase